MAEMIRIMENTQRRLEELERTLNAPPPPLIVNIYETPDADPNDGWGATIAATNFTLHNELINMVQANQFSGRPEADPNSHLSTFVDICDTVRINQVNNDVVCLKLFTFSLGDANHWFNGLDRSTIHTWEELRKLS